MTAIFMPDVCVLYKSVENATALQQPRTPHGTKLYFSLKSLACR
ncbi:hypothetical protein CBM2606_A110209 [Cupriavidus taiwanensis]|nr:hypothetical protein CBM2606_A110209 [Cupriavidus taiwanensis]